MAGARRTPVRPALEASTCTSSPATQLSHLPPLVLRVQKLAMDGAAFVVSPCCAVSGGMWSMFTSSYPLSNRLRHLRLSFFLILPRGRQSHSGFICVWWYLGYWLRYRDLGSLSNVLSCLGCTETQLTRQRRILVKYLTGRTESDAHSAPSSCHQHEPAQDAPVPARRACSSSTFSLGCSGGVRLRVEFSFRGFRTCLGFCVVGRSGRAVGCFLCVVLRLVGSLPACACRVPRGLSRGFVFLLVFCVFGGSGVEV